MGSNHAGQFRGLKVTFSKGNRRTKDMSSMRFLRLSEVHSGHVLGFGASDVLALCVREALRAVC